MVESGGGVLGRGQTAPSSPALESVVSSPAESGVIDVPAAKPGLEKTTF